MPIARADSWKRLPAPAKRADLPFDAVYDADQYARLRQGLIPQEMEDKWFIYLEDGQLCLHRSWTGTWIYALRLEPEEKRDKSGETAEINPGCRGMGRDLSGWNCKSLTESGRVI